MILKNQRAIAYLDLNSFHVSVEQLRNCKLIGKPSLIGGIGDRGVVALCSYKARKFGYSQCDANGNDDTPVVPYDEQKSISTEKNFWTGYY